MAKIFINYAMRDSSFMDPIFGELIKSGKHDVWNQKLITPGMDWWHEIQKAIRDSDCMVVLLSPFARESRFVIAEIQIALDRNIPIIPILVAGDYQTSLPLSLQTHQFLDFRIEKNIDALNKAIDDVVRPNKSQKAQPTHQPSPVVPPKKPKKSIKIFISYQRQNQTIVENLVSLLQGMNHTVWYDQHLTGGHKWWDGICAEIRNCDLFITALSPTYLDSEACRLEYEYAHELNKRILPIEIVKIRSYNELPVQLGAIQAQQLLQIDDSAKSTFTTIFEKLPPFEEMPNPLPKQPDMPVHPLSVLKDQAEARELGEDNAQRLLIAKLEDYLFGENESDSELAHKILVNLKKRKDILYATGDKITRLLKQYEAR